MKRFTPGFSALALLLASTAVAAPVATSGPRAETRAEAQARSGRLFDKLDLNHDGTVSREELAAAHAREPGLGGAADQRDSPERPGGDRSGHWGYDDQELRGLVRMILHRADPGHTGTVTRDAFVAAALSLFDQADTDHDGILTPDEHRAVAEMMRARMAQHGGWHHRPDGDTAMPDAPPAGN